MSDTAARDAISTMADEELFVEARADDERGELICGPIVMVTKQNENHGQIPMS